MHQNKYMPRTCSLKSQIRFRLIDAYEAFKVNCTQTRECRVLITYISTRIYIFVVFVVLLPLLGCTPENDRLDLVGVWKPSAVSFDDPNWRIADLACRGGCSAVGYRYLEALLRDPSNGDRSVKELFEQTREYQANYVADLLTPEAKRQQQDYEPADDPALDCTPDRDGLRHQITAPVPIQIEQSADKVVIRYEYWNAVRTVHMDGRDHPAVAEATRLGHSIGWYEDSSLVVETVNMIPIQFNLPGGHIFASRDAVFTERYTRSDDGIRLDLEWAVFDPVHFREPYKGVIGNLLAPGWELDEWVCEAITGEF